VWRQFREFSHSLPTLEAFRDNSLAGLIHSTTWLAFGHRVALAHLAGVSRIVYGVCTLALLAWLVARALERESASRKRAPHAAADEDADVAAWLRLGGAAADALALTLILAPVTWEHHYILAIPIAISAIASRGRERPWEIGIAVAVIFVVPTFDVYPLSYHRLAGLLALLALTPPREARAWAEQRAALA